VNNGVKLAFSFEKKDCSIIYGNLGKWNIETEMYSNI